VLEGGIRVPFCVQWKAKLPAGQVYDQPVIQLDILATAVAAAAGSLDSGGKLDGVDLRPYLTGQTAGPPHDALYWRSGNQWAIRKGDWKLVVSRTLGPQPRLFNLKDDIGESRDLSASYPEKMNELAAEWQTWNAEQQPPRWRMPSAQPIPFKLIREMLLFAASGRTYNGSGISHVGALPMISK
jgi:arylsulfatase A-like enzyme